MSIEIVIKQNMEISQKELTKIEIIKKFNKILYEMEKTRVRFCIHEFVNKKG